MNLSFLEKRLERIASGFDRRAYNSPIEDRPPPLHDGWVYVGYVPRPETRLGWFLYHLIHGIAMRYPLKSVIAFSLINTKRGNNAKKNTPTTRVDLWLSQADLDHLNNLTNRWQVSRQRIIEQAVAYTATAGTQPVEPTTKYEPQTRVILNLDSITLAQLDQIAPKRTPALRAALGAFAIN